jgi:hypothetical protein
LPVAKKVVPEYSHMQKEWHTETRYSERHEDVAVTGGKKPKQLW